MAKKKVIEEEETSIDPFILAITGNKSFAGQIGFGNFIPRREGISTGSIALDLKLGGSLPRDRVIEYFGPPSSCKTSMALMAMKNYVDKYGYEKIPFIVDVERSITPQFVEGYGIDPDRVLVVRPDTAEAGLDMTSNLVRSGKCGLGIYDSVDAMETEKESHRSLKDASMAELPRLMSRTMRKLCKETIDNNCGIIFVNQIRSTLSMYGPSEATSGGISLVYYSHIRIRWSAKPSDTLEGALKLTPKIKKNKLAPLITADSEFNFFPGKGVDKSSDYLAAGLQVGAIVQAGPMYNVINGDELIKCKGKDGFKTWGMEPQNLLLLRDLIHSRWAIVSKGLEVSAEEEEDDDETKEDTD